MFDQTNGLGASILRLQNVYRYQSSPNFDPDSTEIVKQAVLVRNGAPIAIRDDLVDPTRFAQEQLSRRVSRHQELHPSP